MEIKIEGQISKFQSHGNSVGNGHLLGLEFQSDGFLLHGDFEFENRAEFSPVT